MKSAVCMMLCNCLLTDGAQICFSFFLAVRTCSPHQLSPSVELLLYCYWKLVSTKGSDILRL